MKPATGRICGALGLILLAWSALIWIIFSSKVLVGAHLGVAVVLLAAFAWSNFGQLGEFATSRGTFFLFLTGFGTLFLLAAIIAGNYVAASKDISWDVTKNKLHTLAPDTTKTLQGLKDDLEVLAFFGSGDQNMDAAKDLLDKYSRESKRVKVEWIDPSQDPVLVKKYGVKKDTGHRLVVLYPAPKPGEAEAKAPTEQRVSDINEEALTNAIVKATHQSEKTIYFVTGHNESDLDDTKAQGLAEVKKRMENEGLKAAKLNLASTPEIAKDAAAVVVPGPLVDLLPTEVETLKKYLNAGGRALVMTEPLTTTPNLNGPLLE